MTAAAIVPLDVILETALRRSRRWATSGSRMIVERFDALARRERLFESLPAPFLEPLVEPLGTLFSASFFFASLALPFPLPEVAVMLSASLRLPHAAWGGRNSRYRDAPRKSSQDVRAT